MAVLGWCGYGSALSRVVTVAVSYRETPNEPWLNTEVGHLHVLGNTSHWHLGGAAIRKGDKARF